jgi:hypothetical protein
MTRPRELRGPGKIYRGLLRRLLRSAAAHITVATTTATASAATTTFAGTFVEFLAATTAAASASASAASAATQVFTLRTSAAHFGLAAAAAAGHDAHAAALLLGIRRAGAIARSERDLEFIEFVPLGIRTIAIGDGQQLLHALAR